jgi:chaperonin GroEL
VIASNAGKDGAVVARKVAAGKGSFGYNALTDQFGDMFEWGIVDPTKVTRTALQNAVSVATLLLTCDTIITEKPKDEKDSGGDGDDHEDMDM